MRHLLLFLISFLSIHQAESAARPKDVIIFVQDSSNTRLAVPSLQRSVSQFLSIYGGRSRNFHFSVYRYSHKSEIEKLVGTREADDLMAALTTMATRPMNSSYCYDGCCCSNDFFKLLGDVMKEDHPFGGLLFILYDCYYDPDQSDLDELKNLLQSTKSVVYSVRSKNSYCIGMPQTPNAYWTSLSGFEYEVDSGNVGQLLYTLLLGGFNSSSVSGLYAVPCANQSLRANVRFDTQALLFVLARGHNNRPLTLTGPTGIDLTKNRVELVVDDGKTWAVAWFAGCEEGWEFHEGRCFLRGPQRTTFNKAAAACKEMNATLFVDLSAKNRRALLENDRLWSPVNDENRENDVDSESTWLSLTDGNTRRSFQWGLFDQQYIDLDHMAGTAWAKGEPSSLLPAGSRCALLNRLTGSWTTALCSSLRPYTCVRGAYVFGDEAPRKLLPTGDYRIKIDAFRGCDYNFYTLY